MRKAAGLPLLLAVLSALAVASDKNEVKIPADAKVFVAPMPDDFHEYLKAALAKKKVPLRIVESREEAEYEITGHTETQKASTAKKLILWDWHSNEQASIKVAHLESGVVVFAYSVHKKSSAHGKRSTAEACAKHLKKAIAAK